MNNNQKIIFDLPGDITAIDVIDEILKNNGLEESTKEFLKKDDNDQEPRLIIVRDAALSIFEEKVPENKITEILAKHLEAPREIAEKIVAEVKEKLIPYAKIINLDQEKKEEEIIQKITTPKPEIKVDREKIIPFVKKVETKNVEENAKKMVGNITDEKETMETKKVKTVLPQEEKKGPDDYREPIE